MPHVLVTGEMQPALEFGRFRLSPQRREVLADGRPVELGGRALDVLTLLVQARGALVTKEEIMRRVWPNAVVEENNLQVQISALRKMLGPDRQFIQTISGRGYRFVAAVRRIELPVAAASPPAQPSAAPPAAAGRAGPNDGPLRPGSLPVPVADLIGREGELAAVVDFTLTHRFVTLTGAGGIGKTRLALEVGRALLARFADGVRLADLAPLVDPAHVAPAVAGALGLEPLGRALSPGGIAAAVAGKQLLLILDNCEHLIEAVTQIAEATVHAGPGLQVLATSREPLGGEGEQVYRVPPLAVPEASRPTAGEALGHGAVRLLVTRVRAADPRFELDDAAASHAVAICRRLDGMPLAIELAAARASAVGIESLAAHIDDLFRLLTGGRRTALPRHQTLRATLDWSYRLLSEPERAVLRRLCIFAGSFRLEAAGAAAADGAMTASEVIGLVSNLVAKSLVSTEVRGPVVRYRLLETTRAFGGELLAAGDELATVAERLIAYYQGLLEQAEASREASPAGEWLALYGPEIDNVRALLRWAFGAGGRPALGVGLTVATLPLWIQLSLLGECREWVERALGGLAADNGKDRRREMLLQASLANATLATEGTVKEIGDAWNRALELARTLDDTEYQLRSLYGLYLYTMRIGGYRAGLDFARRFRAAAERSADRTDQLMGERIVGVSLHYLGDPVAARSRIEAMLAGYAALSNHLHAVRFGIDQRVAALFHLARILWVLGLPDQALRTAEASVAEAERIDHVASTCFALADGACPVATWTGDIAAVERFLGMLMERAEKYGLGFWHVYGLAWRGRISIIHGDRARGIALLRRALEGFRGTQFDLHYVTFLSALARALGEDGRPDEGLATIDEAIARATCTDENWCFAELLRIKGRLLLLAGRPQAADDHFQGALDRARRQHSLSWELRAAISLAELWRDRGRGAAGRDLLSAVHGRFSEGFATADLKKAKALIDALA